MSDDDKKDDMSREQERTLRREDMSPEAILGAVTAHLGRTENRHFEPDDEQALLSQKEHKCGDGRDDRLERFGMFGGTLGLMASGVANLDRLETEGQPLPLEDEDQVIEDMVDMLGGVSCHTAHHKGVHRECGHVYRLANNPEKYGLVGRFGKAFVRFLKQIDEPGADSRVHSVSYSGGHNEIAVVKIVNGDGHRLRVRGFDKETGIQVFVWHETQVNHAAAELSEWLYDYARVYEASSVSKNDFRDKGVEIINDQFLATAQELAPGYEIIRVQPGENQTLDIQAIGTVPVPA